MFRTLSSLVAVCGVVLAGITVSGDTLFRSTHHDYRVVTVVDALVQPWSIAFLPGGDTLITERPGRLRIVRQGKLAAAAGRGRADGVPLEPGRSARSRCRIRTSRRTACST